jgi:hypothetical protein
MKTKFFFNINNYLKYIFSLNLPPTLLHIQCKFQFHKIVVGFIIFETSQNLFLEMTALSILGCNIFLMVSLKKVQQHSVRAVNAAVLRNSQFFRYET